MNAAARTMDQGSLFQGNLKKLILTFDMLLVMLLSIAIVVSSVSVVYDKNRYRQYFSTVELLQQRDHAIQVEWTQLLLEQSSLVTSEKIRRTAEQRYAMSMPDVGRIEILYNHATVT